MKSVLGVCLIFTAICSAQGTDNSNVVTRMSPEEISGRIRERLEARGIRIEDLTRAVQEHRSNTRSVRHTVTPQAMRPSALSQRAKRPSVELWMYSTACTTFMWS